MRKYLFACWALLACLGTAEAQTCNRFNGTTWCRDPNGYRSVENRFNGITQGHDNAGNSWTTNRFNNQSWTRTTVNPYQKWWA
jgi:hypothetical protein